MSILLTLVVVLVVTFFVLLVLFAAVCFALPVDGARQRRRWRK